MELQSLKSASAEELATQIVIYRLVGLRKDMAILCMQEIDSRKKAGDEFDYDGFIKQKLDESPKPDRKTMDMINNVIKNGIKNV